MRWVVGIVIAGILVYLLNPKVPGLDGGNIGDLIRGGIGEVFSFFGRLVGAK